MVAVTEAAKARARERARVWYRNNRQQALLKNKEWCRIHGRDPVRAREADPKVLLPAQERPQIQSESQGTGRQVGCGTPAAGGLSSVWYHDARAMDAGRAPGDSRSPGGQGGGEGRVRKTVSRVRLPEEVPEQLRL